MKVAEMTEARGGAASSERRRRARKMMAELQVAFGEVVDAAIAGDFSQRVDAEFPDAELNTLAAQRQQPGRDRRSRAGGDRRRAGGAGRGRPDAAHEGDYQGAFAKLKADTNAVADKLTDIVGQLRDTSRTLKTATGEILSGANDLSERTTKQAATIEETSAAMEQLAATVIDNAKRAEDASVKAEAVSRSAEEGGAVMAPGDRGDGADHHLLVQDLQHHRHDRRHRLPDQPAGAQRFGGSGAGRRSRQGLCGGGDRSAAAGAVGGAGLLARSRR